jgi:AraC-like DNA-binding protein
MILRENPEGFRIIKECLRQTQRGIDKLNNIELSTTLKTLRSIVFSELENSLHSAIGHNTGPALESLFQIKTFIDSNIRSPKLNVDHICVTLGISRASLYRLFTPVGGIAEYVRKQRLAAILEELTSPQFANKRIGGIAFKWGFTNFGTFCRCFRDEYGMSPREARAIALSGGRPERPEERNREISSLGNWLKKTSGR